MSTSQLSSLPSVDLLLRTAECKKLNDRYGRSLVTRCIQDHLNSIRQSATQDKLATMPDADFILKAVSAMLQDHSRSEIKAVLNLTGTLIHTNLGRSLLPETALETLTEIAGQASNLEYDLHHGARGDRDAFLEKIITELSGAEAATVVNNNAAAILLVLNSFADGKEVPVSRGELVEIGGSFRIPDVMAKSGAKLIEIGTTNRTHFSDYENSINPHTALLLKVHTSNYEITGFTQSVSERELSGLASKAGIPLVNDLGSGTLLDLRQFNLPHEPTIRESIEQGVDLVTFSGDKLLGGPQAGIIAGRKDLVDAIRKNPLKRALRVDKMTVTALTETLKLYRTPERLKRELPTIRHLSREVKEVEQLAHQLAHPIAQKLGDDFQLDVIAVESQVGSGSLPTARLPSFALAIRPNTGSPQQTLVTLNQKLHETTVPVIGRIHDGQLLLDLRTLDDGEILMQQFNQLR